MKHFLLSGAFGLGLLMAPCAKEPEKIAPHRVCIGVNKCIGSMWPLSEVEEAYGTRGSEVEEGIKEICIRRAGIFLRLQYDLRSTGGLESPAALDVASNGPPENCKAVSVEGPGFVVSPVALGESDNDVRSALGEPDEVWVPQTSAHGILPGERGFVYGGPENAFVLVVLRGRRVVRVAGSVLP